LKFIDWLETECQALERYDAMCRGEIPPGEVEFHKASGEPFFEFVEFSKDNDDGSRTTVIANAGGLEMFEKAQAQAPDLGGLAEQLDGTLAQVKDLAKRVDSLVAAQKDLVEVSPEQLAALFDEAIGEAGAD